MFEAMAVRILGGYEGVRNQLYADNKARRFHALSLRLDGSAVLEFGGTRRRVGKGVVAYIPAHADYRIECDHEYIIVVHFEAYPCTENEIMLFTPSNPDYYQDSFQRIIKRLASKTPWDSLYAASELYMLFSAIEKELSESRFNLSDQMKQSVDYLHRNFTDSSLCLSRLTSLAGVSETHYRRLFHKLYQTSPVQYINKLRLDYAQSLLLSGVYSVVEAADKAGFTDPKYFTRLFRKKKGLPPSAFKMKRFSL